MEVKRRFLALPLVAALALTPACAEARSGRGGGKAHSRGHAAVKHGHSPAMHSAGRRVH
jgi:hypothetical protein